MAETRCRHCNARIKPCHCGANGGRSHWVDDREDRYCPREATRLHEPAILHTDQHDGGERERAS